MVDVREFMSSLPAVLHQSNMDIVPVTLEVTTRPVCSGPSWTGCSQFFLPGSLALRTGILRSRKVTVAHF